MLSKQNSIEPYFLVTNNTEDKHILLDSSITFSSSISLDVSCCLVKCILIIFSFTKISMWSFRKSVSFNNLNNRFWDKWAYDFLKFGISFSEISCCLSVTTFSSIGLTFKTHWKVPIITPIFRVPTWFLGIAIRRYWNHIMVIIHKIFCNEEIWYFCCWYHQGYTQTTWFNDFCTN